MIIAAQVSIFPTALFPSSAAALIFSVVFVLWILSEIVGAEIVPRLRRGGARTRRGGGRGSSLLIYVDVTTYLGIAFSFAGADITKLPSWVFYPGVILMAVGIVVRQWSIAVLGRFFSGALRVQKDKTLVESGPHPYVRHPSYTGALIFFAGLGLALQSSNPTHSYPIIRLPRALKGIAGETVPIYQTEKDGSLAFFVVPKLDKFIEATSQEDQEPEQAPIDQKSPKKQRPRARFEPASWPPQGHRITRLPYLGT
jgi:protein-S-isoprenylcysteine O-methyltransferase Ste14